MRLQALHEEFIEKAERPMRFGALPVKPSEPDVPVLPASRWREAGAILYKEYVFRRSNDRDNFVVQLLAYEASVGHRAEIRVTPGRVALSLSTGDVGHVTELDREHARYADVLFRELVYSPTNEDED